MGAILKTIASVLTVSVMFGSAVAAEVKPVEITEKDQCASCSMWIERYPGPKGEILFDNGDVFKYCSARGMACEYLKLGSEEQTKVKALYAHNAQNNDWKKPSDDRFIDARKAWFVYGSSMKAVMGPSLAPFDNFEAAQAFQKEHGGTIYRFDELTQEILGCKARN